MLIETQIKLDRFKPRPYQEPIFDAIVNKGYRRVIAVLPRRAGKDIACWNLMIRMALKTVGVYFMVYPTYSQGRKILWDSLTNAGARFLDYIPIELIENMNQQEMKIRLTNQSIIQIIGSDNFDSLVGTNPRGCVFSEYALQDPRAYQFLRPALTAIDGWAIFISTPRGKNHLWELYQIAQNNKNDWFSYKLTVEDTGHIPLYEIQKELATGEMSEDLVQQEYYCFPPGQYIMTHNKMTPIEDIKEDDLVVSHSGRLRKVLKTMSRDYTGELIEIKSFGSFEIIRCTPNHPLMTYDYHKQAYSWKEAQDLTNKDRLVFPKMHIGNMPMISYELCMLIAWYICDGSSFKNGIQFTVNIEKTSRVTKLLDKRSIEYKINERPEDSVNNIIVNSVQLVDFFKVNCGVKCHDKRIPFSLIARYEEDFFHELMRGDGCLSKTEKQSRYVFTTVSKHLAYQVQLLANSLSNGYAAGITKRKNGDMLFPNGKIYKCKDSYVVQIPIMGIRDRISPLIRAKRCIAAQVSSVVKVQYSGKVYNFSVQYDESYLVAGRAVHNCSFDLGVEGSYYSKFMNKMRLEGRIGIVPYETGFKVHTSWDLGVHDKTVIIFYQTVGQIVRVIDYYENSDKGLDYYAKILKSKDYLYGKHFAPHDIAVRELSTGLSRIEAAKKLGINFTVLPNLPIEDGIECVKGALSSKIWIDESNCKVLINSLESYRREYDSKRKVYHDRPLHDTHSHASDSFRYLCLSLPKTRDGLSAEELDRRYQQAMGGDRNANMPSIFRDDLPFY